MFTKQYSVCALQRNMNINIGEYVDLDVTVKKKKKKKNSYICTLVIVTAVLFTSCKSAASMLTG